MKNSYILAVGAAFAAVTVFGKSSTPAGWTDDFDAALKKAAAENKTVLADFSGSDWCCWCQRLDKEVFATEEFMKVATNKYVCVMIDSPSDQSVLSEKAKKQNPGLVKHYGVSGFPTVMMLNSNGEVLFKTGYQKGGPVKYLEHLEAKAREQVGAKAKEALTALKSIEPITERLSKANEAIEADIKAREEALTKSGVSKTDKAFFEQMMKAICTEVLPKRLPELRQAIDEAKAVQVPAEMEAEKNRIIAGFEATYNGMSGVMNDYGKKRPSQK